VEVGIVGKNY